MWWATIVSWLTSFWSRIQGFVIWAAAGAGALLAAIFSYRYSIRKAEKRGETDERERVERETLKEQAKMEDRADEVREDIDALDRDSLRERMRDEARKNNR